MVPAAIVSAVFGVMPIMPLGLVPFMKPVPAKVSDVVLPTEIAKTLDDDSRVPLLISVPALLAKMNSSCGVVTLKLDPTVMVAPSEVVKVGDPDKFKIAVPAPDCWKVKF